MRMLRGEVRDSSWMDVADRCVRSGRTVALRLDSAPRKVVVRMKALQFKAFSSLMLMLTLTWLIAGQELSADEPELPSLNPAKLLAQLKERDKQFIDVQFVFDKIRTEIVNLSYIASQEAERIKSNPLLTDIPRPFELFLDIPYPIRVDYSSRESLTTKDGVMTIETFGETVDVVDKNNTLWEAKKGLFQPSIHGRVAQRCSDSKNRLRSTRDDEVPPFVWHYSQPNSLLLLRYEELCLRLSLGYGITDRIVTLNEVNAFNSGIQALGTISVWSEDHSRFELLIDDEMVIRQAIIRTEGGGTFEQLHTSCEGEFPDTILPRLPTSGSCVVTTGRIGGERPDPLPKKNCRINLLKATSPVSSQEFIRLTSFPETAGTVVFDTLKGTSGGYHERHLLAENRGQQRAIVIFIGNVVFVVFVVLCIRFWKRPGITED